MKRRLLNLAFLFLSLVCGAAAIESDILTGRSEGRAYIARLATVTWRDLPKGDA